MWRSRDENITDCLHFPLIVKPLHEDASIGITIDSVVFSEKQLQDRVAWIIETFHEYALVEQYIDGREINVSIIGNGNDIDVLPVSEILFDFPAGMPKIVGYEALRYRLQTLIHAAKE